MEKESNRIEWQSSVRYEPPARESTCLRDNCTRWKESEESPRGAYKGNAMLLLSATPSQLSMLN